MSDIAVRFRASKARIVIFLLDCCFSGAAPARVLEDSIRLRDVELTFETIGGKGRVLIAASNSDEPALEDPSTRHGLFTKALLDCLQAAVAPVNLLSVISEVIPQVRTNAARFGYIQTPVMFGYIEGELSFPQMKPGNKFTELFPDLQGTRVSEKFQDLDAYNISQPIIDLWSSRYPDGLNSLQLSAINEYGILNGESLFVVAPTSSGKTFVGEVAALKTINEGKKAVFLLPYKALVNEKFKDFQELYGRKLGLRIARCSGDWQDQIGEILHGKYDIAFFTYETFLNLSITRPQVLHQLGLVVLDEAQFVTDTKRGIVVELLLTNLVSAKHRGIEPQIITLSAVIGSTNSFEKWLECKLLRVDKRPVPLVEGVMDRTGTYQNKDVSGNINSYQILPPAQIRQRKQKPESQDMIVPLVKKLVLDGEKVIVFRSNRGSASGCAVYLANELGLSPATDILNILPQLDLSTTSQQLATCLRGGTVFHSADLTREERVIVEEAFRNPNSGIQVLVATSTVAAGVNTPASTVVIVESQFPGATSTPYSVAQYKNMAGRAGRLGYETLGKSILLADNYMARNNLFRRYIEGTPEPISSSFDPASPGTWVIRLLAQVKRVTRDQAVELVINTYGGYVKNLQDPGWLPRFKAQIYSLISRMEIDGLVEPEGEEFIRLTILGHACGQSPLTLNSSLQLVETLKLINAEDLNLPNLMALVQGLPEQDDDYTPLGRGQSEANRVLQVGAKFGRFIAGALQKYAGSDLKYYARCKRCLILLDWINGVPLEDIEKNFSPNSFVKVGHGDIRGFADATRFYLGSASRICAIIYPGSAFSEEEINAFLKQLDIGLPIELLGLTTINADLNRGQYLALGGAGVRSIDQLKNVSFSQLRAVLGLEKATEVFRSLDLVVPPENSAA